MTGFDIRGTAVVLLDCEEGVASGVFAQSPEDRAAFTQSLATLLDTVDDLGLPCIRVDVEFRPGHPEVSPRNAYFTGAKGAGRLVAGTEATEPLTEVSEQLARHPRATKRRIGGFAGSDLAYLLAGLDCDGVILAGLITRGAVLSTACDAADKDLRVAVLSDSCYDPDPEVHRVLTTSVLPIRASMITVADLASADLRSRV
ncbi:isochorismatase family protein [Rhodococcus opacus]|uniref:Isochorismatase n=1 Tax=Rhodococcus opacus TaxID=37919 RepID=A0A2S8J982_RHOOP|nr:isochorismatase family protein [Rhodococcus opacus]PQP23547.1 isochorismatase [Rhodococcus opacus]